jgi:hypothetical protein
MPELLAPSAVPSVDEPLYSDNQAYVSGWTLVAHFPTATWSPGFVNAPYVLVPVSQVVLAGHLTQVGGQWALQDAVIGMRARIIDWLTALGELPDPQHSLGILCQNAAEYRLWQQAYCNYVDIASIPGPPSAPCDALSAGGLFQAKQAQLGDVLLPTPPPAALTCASEIAYTCEPAGG